jgi:hypothetical protein
MIGVARVARSRRICSACSAVAGFEAENGRLANALGDAERVAAMHACCTGLWLRGGREGPLMRPRTRATRAPYRATVAVRSRRIDIRWLSRSSETGRIGQRRPIHSPVTA